MHIISHALYGINQYSAIFSFQLDNNYQQQCVQPKVLVINLLMGKISGFSPTGQNIALMVAKFGVEEWIFCGPFIHSFMPNFTAIGAGMGVWVPAKWKI